MNEEGREGGIMGICRKEGRIDRGNERGKEEEIEESDSLACADLANLTGVIYLESVSALNFHIPSLGKVIKHIPPPPHAPHRLLGNLIVISPYLHGLSEAASQQDAQETCSQAKPV